MSFVDTPRSKIPLAGSIHAMKQAIASAYPRIFPGASATTKMARRCLGKFLHYFPKGFSDPKYLAWERDYKWSAHKCWEELLGKDTFLSLLKASVFQEIASRAVRVESRTNWLFSFEKMAIRDAVRSPHGARTISEGLYEFLHACGDKYDRLSAGVMWLTHYPANRPA
jgi:hypothetical protein